MSSTGDVCRAALTNISMLKDTSVHVVSPCSWVYYCCYVNYNHNFFFSRADLQQECICKCVFFLFLFFQEMAKILNHPRVYSFLHVPVQSASDNVLADMKREYCVDDFRHVVDFLKDK